MIRYGKTRLVFIFANKVFKIPRISNLIKGISANRREAMLSGSQCYLCPATQYIWGIVITMPRADIIGVDVDIEVDRFDILQNIINLYGEADEVYADYAPNNWGYVDCKLVKIDYGNDGIAGMNAARNVIEV